MNFNSHSDARPRVNGVAHSSPSARPFHPETSAMPSIPPSPTRTPGDSPSDSDIYGPGRHHQTHNHQSQPPQPQRAFHQPRQHDRLSSSTAPAVRFDEAQLAILGTSAAPMSGLKDALAIAASRVTPGVDDTPYIQYAIEALTRRKRNPNSEDDFSDDEGDFEADMAPAYGRPASRRVPDEEMGFGGAAPVSLPQTTYAGDREPRRPMSAERPPPSPSPLPVEEPRTKRKEDFLVIRPTPPLGPLPTQEHRPQTAGRPQTAAETLPSAAVPHTTGNESDQWVPVTKIMRENYYPNDKTYPPLTFKPRILRPFSMMILMAMCIFMIAGLIVSVVYSDQNIGLTEYPGSIYNGEYFLFRILPQLLACVILVYAQAIQATSMRILPFVSMASEDARQRYLALFQQLHPTTFLWPRLSGPWQMQFFSLSTWLMLFTIPLQSAAFTCIFNEGGWIWGSVQGVAWALVVLYIIQLTATAILMVFWFGKWTGLVWDVRSIADLIPLLNRSNTTHSYRGKAFALGGRGFKNELRDRWFDRLGYWRTEDMQTGGIWYAIAASGSPSHADQDPRALREMLSGSKRPASQAGASLASHDLAVPTNLSHENARYRYLPLCLRNVVLVPFAVVTSVLLLVLLIISFLPQTRLESGFDPLVPARPGDSDFSAANFLYSFIPSLLGMLLFLAFQSLDLALRTVQPWGELSSRPEGSVARKSILADYASCLPLQAPLRAARLGHWRVCITSLMSTLFLAIPVLAGGLFMALTRISDSRVRMFPSIPVYGVLLAFLFLYVGCVSLLLPRRRQFRLPHSVTTLADVISFCSAEELSHDAAFRSVRSGADLRTRLGADAAADPRDESVWFFGVVPGKDERTLSVRRVRRFTEKLTMKRTSTRSMV